MFEISISTEFSSKWPGVKLACIECDVELVEKNDELWSEIDKHCNLLQTDLKIEGISKLPAIQYSRKAYKACGKDPARYRLSAESLLRRVIKGNKLYQINNVVDIVNLASVHSGFSIGGYDIAKIEGNIELGIGLQNEPYQGIGRGELNIEGLPVLRDSISAFGSPTSDSERTSVTLNTKRFLMIYYGFGANDSLDENLEYAQELLMKYSDASNLKKYDVVSK